MTSPADRPTGRTTFIIPVRNNAHALARCLRSIQRQKGDPADVRIVVVDNGSTDASARVAREHGADVLELPGLKVGELRNRGAAVAGSDILAFVDADHEIGSGWLAAAVRALQQPDVAAVGFPYSAPAEATWVQRIYDAFRPHPSDVQSIAWLGAGNMAVSANAFREAGGFDAALEACEDVALCQALTRAGSTLLSVPEMHSIHYGDPATLAALFVSELWRGRDNLRVSLRGSLGPRELLSIAAPVVDLIALVGVAAGVWWPTAGVASGAVILALAAGRALALWLRLPRRTWLDLPRSFMVAVTYDLARSLALVARKQHRRAQPARDVTAAMP